MTTPNGPLNNFGLHRAALDGDDEGVRRAIRDGANINGLDNEGRTALICVVAGENWRQIDASYASFMSQERLLALKTILTHPELTLNTLNAFHSSMNGVTPLCLAAWMDQPAAVRVLLDASADTVSVDGMDIHGATALMYAARDGNLEVARILLSHGARPDFRDRNHRTTLQFAIPHPQILWLCENVIRRHRWHESKSAERTRLSPENQYLVNLSRASISNLTDFIPPPKSIFTPTATRRLTNTLISCIRQDDLSFIQSLLFAPAVDPSSLPGQYPMSVPALVNLPDSNGWSLVHHCVSAPRPSIGIIDALYCAGADVSLFTLREKHTPLHILAQCVQPSDDPDVTHSLRAFCLHLIQDLRAPLSARDENDETCLHFAAEHGNSADLLSLFLNCDTTGIVRNMKNSRGLTPMEVCKPELLYVFGVDGPRCSSALSNRTVRPMDSFASLSSIQEDVVLTFETSNDSSSLFSPGPIDVDYMIQQLLSNLRASSDTIAHPATDEHIREMEEHVEDAKDQCTSIAVHFRARIEEANKSVDELHTAIARLESIRTGVLVAAHGKLLVRGITPMQSRRRNRDSEDSQLTAVDPEDDMVLPASPPPRVPMPENVNYSSTGTQTSLLDLYAVENASRTASVVLDHFTMPSAPTSSAQMSSLWAIEQEIKELDKQTTPTNTTGSNSGMKLKQAMKKRQKLEDKLQELQCDLQRQKKEAPSGTARLKAWIKRMVVPPQPALRPLIVMALDDSCVGHEVKGAEIELAPPVVVDAAEAHVDDALRTSKVVLEAAQRDLELITECLEAAERFIDNANHTISRTQRIVKRALKKREQVLVDLRSRRVARTLAVPGELSPGLLGYEQALSTRPSLASITTIYSVSSSVSSVAETLTEPDDDDVRLVRRLLLRKIEAQISGAWVETERAKDWLPLVREAVRSVKRRTYL